MDNDNCAPLNDVVVRSMKGNKRRDTKPELAVRKALRDAGYPGYRLQWDVAGHPDICYPGRRVAIFVNGCFWHRCPRCNLPMPVHNRDFWEAKFERNMARDRRDTELLESEGWKVVTVWECEIRDSLEDVICRLVDALDGRVRSQLF